MKKDAEKPYQDSRLAKLVADHVLEQKFKKSQAEIAAEAGFINPNMVTIIKKGASKLPIDRVPALAKALECDPSLILRLALEQSEGSTAATAIFDIVGELVTQNERAWIAEIRDASSASDPRLTARAKAALRTMSGK